MQHNPLYKMLQTVDNGLKTIINGADEDTISEIRSDIVAIWYRTLNIMEQGSYRGVQYIDLVLINAIRDKVYVADCACMQLAGYDISDLI